MDNNNFQQTNSGMKHTKLLLLALIYGLKIIAQNDIEKKAEFDESSITNQMNSSKYFLIWSHNDYEQEYPLKTALKYKAQIIEADVHLINGYLYVSHDRPQNIEKTPLLGDMYFNPLIKLLLQDKEELGHDFPKPFYLAIDIKTEANESYLAILKELKPYKKYLSHKENGVWKEGFVSILLTGNRPILNEKDSNQLVFLDGRMSEIEKCYPENLYPIISCNWWDHFSWGGKGKMPDSLEENLKRYVNLAHKHHKIIRFWGTPDNESIWEVLVQSGVDIINVDNLKHIYNFRRKSIKKYSR